ARAEITPELAPQIPLFTQELPEIHEIIDALKLEAVEGLPPHLSIGELEAIAHSSIGLYISDIINAITAIHHRYSPQNAKELAEKLFNYKV
ncbi:MAG TPA: AAA family ATPase, partial [Cyanobacteria bacterium UBA8543]|nr:AAA family ATPase [Cyanobacteria bacterium UBA8543]